MLVSLQLFEIKENEFLDHSHEKFCYINVPAKFYVDQTLSFHETYSLVSHSMKRTPSLASPSKIDDTA